MVRSRLASPEFRDLVEKLAVWPHGLGFLHLADIDTIAVALDVHPFVVAAAREALEDPRGRAQLIEEVRQARARSGGKPLLREPRRIDPSRPSSGPKTEEDLIREAGTHPLGLSFLVEGHPEVVAVTFCVHPELVFRARDRLNREKKVQERKGERDEES